MKTRYENETAHLPTSIAMRAGERDRGTTLIAMTLGDRRDASIIDRLIRGKPVSNKAPTASAIKAQVEGQSPFFDRKTMKFFGDSMANFGTYRHSDGTIRLYRKKPVKHGLRGEWIFNPSTLTFRKV